MQKKAVLDTNVWVSYFINSRADYLIEWIVENSEIIFYTSTALAEELEEVLGRPKFKQQFPYLISDFSCKSYISEDAGFVVKAGAFYSCSDWFILLLKGRTIAKAHTIIFIPACNSFNWFVIKVALFTLASLHFPKTLSLPFAPFYVRRYGSSPAALTGTKIYS